MKKNMNEKIKLMLTIMVCALFIAVVFTSAVGKPLSYRNYSTDNKENGNIPLGPSTPKPRPLFNFRILNRDWDYWTNQPHMFSIPTGNVGIGTNEPQATLDIYDYDEPAEIRLASGLSGGSGTINFVNGGWIIRSGLAAPPQALSFRYGGDAVMTLWGDKVGIGTSNPENAFHVNGAINLDPITEPSIPSTGFVIYVDSADGDLKAKASTGTVTVLAID